MLKSDLFFAGAFGFVAGTVAGGLGLAPLGLTLLTTIAFFGSYGFQRLRRFRSAFVIGAIFCLAGNIYYSANDYLYTSRAAKIGRIDFSSGQIIKTPRHGTNSQTIILDDDINQIRIQLQLAPYPELAYGDQLELEGTLEALPNNNYGRYLAKEGIHALLYYPKRVEIINHHGHGLLETLYRLERVSRDKLNRLLTGEQAAIANAVLFGNREDVDPELLGRLSASGTLHLTALSGLHIAIIIFGLEPFFLTIFGGRKRAGALATLIVLGLFVAMTGFKVSALRAVLMAGVANLARHTGRASQPRNAIILAALLLAIINPKVPVFDLGFQLSFAATLAIIYLVPIFKRFPFFQVEGFLHWREILAVTIAAQIGVAPIIINTFGNFSLTALPANLALLVTVPVLLAFGFLTIITSLILPPLADLLSRGLAFLIDYAMIIINFFAEVKIPFNPEFTPSLMIAYYLALLWFVWRYPTGHNKEIHP